MIRIKNFNYKRKVKIVTAQTNVSQGVVNLSVINQKLIIMAQDQKKSQKQDSSKKQDQKSDQKGKQQQTKK